MGMPKFDREIHPRSKAWCAEVGCGWKAYGIWAHKKAHEHFLEHVEGEEHIVYVKEPEGLEQDRGES